MYRKIFLRLTSFSIIFFITIQPLLALDTYVVTDDIVFVRTTPEAVRPEEKLHGDEAYQNKGAGLYFFYGENIKGENNPSNNTVIKLKEKQLKHLDGSPGYGWFDDNGYIDSLKLWKEPPLEKVSSDRCMTLNNTPVYLLPDRKSKNVLSLYKGEVIEAIGKLNYNSENWIKVQTISIDIWNQDYDTMRYGYIPEKDALILVYGKINESSLTTEEIPSVSRWGYGFTEEDKKKLAKNGFYIGNSNGPYLNMDNSHNPYRSDEDHYRNCDAMADSYHNITSSAFITTDLYLHTTHLIFDRMLADTEEYKLYPEIKDMTLKLVTESTKDLHNYKGHNVKILKALTYNVFFFSVAAKLLDPQFVIPVEVETDVRMIVNKIKNATGKEIPSFTNPIEIGAEDYSQYKVRGHYANKNVTREKQGHSENTNNTQLVQPTKEDKKPSIIVKTINKVKNVFKGWFGKTEDVKSTLAPAQTTQPTANAATIKQTIVEEEDSSTTLERYSRAMMWYGRHTHLLSDDEKTLSAIFMVRQIESSGEMGRWERIDRAMTKLFGKTDDYTPTGYKQVVATVYGSAAYSGNLIEQGGDKALQQFRDEVNKSLPKQKIVSSFVQSGHTQDERLDMTAGFKFMGQRFTWDAYMFNQVTSPVIGDLQDLRNIPSALDVMYILGSVAAKKEMDKDVAMHSWAEQYHSQIAKMQKEVEGKLEKKETSYDTWMYGIRALFSDNQSKQYFTQTEAWQYKTMNTALASWTELKHDTLLYTEQSYGGGEGGEGPEPIPTYKLPVIKGYIEPNPVFFKILSDLLAGLFTELNSAGMITDEYKTKLTTMKDLSDTAYRLSLKEVNGEVITDNEYLEILKLPTYFNKGLILPYDSGDIISYDTTRMDIIADVATDTYGGQVLEIATGAPTQIFVVVKDAYGGTRITTGYVYSWYQFTSKERLSDQQWKEKGTEEIKQYKPSWYQKIER